MTDLTEQFSRFADDLDEIVSDPSVEGRPAGSGEGGKKFEDAIGQLWQEFATALMPTLQLSRILSRDVRGRRVTQALCLRNLRNGMEMYFPPGKIDLKPDLDEERPIPEVWLLRKFFVSDLIEGHLGKGPYSFAPPTARDSRRYFGQNYPALFANKTTGFDWCIALAENGAIVEKMLFEYKSSKSSKGETVDGNAHERLAFQSLQYLEVASQLPSCSFNVLMSSAFVHYKNKYHPSFNAQALRLADAYRWFNMRIFSCHSEYVALFSMLSRFLLEGVRPVDDYRSVMRTDG